jgi:hypothetical protein
MTMRNGRPGTKGFFKRHEDAKRVTLLVGADDLTNKDRPYHGPTARVTWDDTWLNICTDDYEGNAMINIEALPHLRRALAYISRSIKAKSSADGEQARGP